MTKEGMELEKDKEKEEEKIRKIGQKNYIMSSLRLTWILKIVISMA